MQNVVLDGLRPWLPHDAPPDWRATLRQHGPRWVLVALAHAGLLWTLACATRHGLISQPVHCLAVLIAPPAASAPPPPAAPAKMPALLPPVQVAIPLPSQPERSDALAPQAPPSVAATDSVAVPVPATPQPNPAPAPLEVSAPRFDVAALHNPEPPYPLASRRLGESGRVLLRVQVSAEGQALAVEIETSSGFARLDEVARATVRQWRFVPARQGAQAVAAWALVPISFALNR